MTADEQKAWEEYIAWVSEDRKCDRDPWDNAAFAADAELKRLREENATLSALAHSNMTLAGIEQAEVKRLREDLGLLLDYFQINEKFIAERHRRRAEGKE